jgi:GNAT superfamily N-acetyltransferase
MHATAVRGGGYCLGMSAITVLPATADRFDALESVFDGGGDGRSCQCQWWTLVNAQYNKTAKNERAQLLREETLAPVAPGLIAEVDGEAAGWVRVGPRTALPRLARSRVYAPHSPEPWSDATVWAVSCFSVRREFRGRGVTAALLADAVEFAREHGAREIEAYPIDTSVNAVRSNELFHGALSTFLHAGFTETARASPNRPIVSLKLR